MTVRIEHADMLEVIPRLVAEGVVCDAVVTDPPYHLLPTMKRFGAANSAPVTVPEFYAADGKSKGSSPYLRQSSGFMGQQWDGGDIAFRPETWATVASVMRPGACLVAFGGTRTHHRVWCAIEDAGFVIQDTIMWLFGSGFPKRRDMLKPAFEPVCLAYKPGGKRTMSIDECRIGTETRTYNGSGPHNIKLQNHGKGDTGIGMMDGSGRHLKFTVDGRWPANICHDGSDEVLAAFPQSESGQPRDDRGRGGFWGSSDGTPCGPQYGDGGSAARFFFSAKAGAEDRWGSRHPTVKPVELMKWLVALVTPPGGLVLDPFAGSGTTGAAALGAGRNAILIEREAAYVADIRERIAFYEGGGTHSAVAKHRNRKIEHGPLFASG